MTVAVIVLLVIAVATLVWAASSTRSASTARAEVERLRGEVVDAERTAAEAGELAAEEARRADAAESSASAAGARAEAAEAAQAQADEAASIAARQADEAATARVEAERAAELADGRAVEAESRVGALEADLEAAAAEAQAAEARLAQATERVAALEAALADAARPAAPDADGGSGGGDAAVDLWPLEVRRLDRLWQERVSVVPTDPPPVAHAEDPVRVAVGVVTEASREESGVVVELVWDEGCAVPAGRAALVVRVAEELVAAAHVSDGGELAVAPAEGGSGVALALRTEPPVALPPDLLAALAALGCELPAGDDTVTVVVPP